MREILFRGKNYDGEWIEGYYVHQGKSHEIYYKDYQEFPSRFVTPETVGQFTGLTDKNGKKIFEGDIVIDSDFPETKYTVDFFEEAFVAKNDNGEIFYLREFKVFGESELEVIGNIHDDSELLEVTE